MMFSISINGTETKPRFKFQLFKVAPTGPGNSPRTAVAFQTKCWKTAYDQKPRALRKRCFSAWNR